MFESFVFYLSSTIITHIKNKLVKKIIVLLYTLYALEDSQSLDVAEHKDLKKYLDEGLKVNHVSAPSLVQYPDEAGVPCYYLSVTVEMSSKEDPRDMLADYMKEILPAMSGMIEKLYSPVPVYNTAPKTGEEYELEIKELLVPELKAKAKEYGIEGYKKMNKASLIKSLVNLYEYEMFGTRTDLHTPKEIKEEAPAAEAPKENPSKKPKEAVTPPPSQSKPNEKSAPKEPKLTKAQEKREKRKARKAAREANEK